MAILTRLTATLLAAVALAGCCIPFDLTGRLRDPLPSLSADDAWRSARPSRSEVDAAFRQAWDEGFRPQHPVYGDGALEAYLDGLLAKLARSAKRPDLTFTVQIIDTNEAQAWALPGGVVWVTRGVLLMMESEAEIAAVLAHEIGHIAAGHVDRPGDADEDQQEQADALAIGYLRAAGYDPRVLSTVLRRLSRSPAVADRILRLWRLEGSAGGTVARDRFLDHLEGMVVSRARAVRPSRVHVHRVSRGGRFADLLAECGGQPDSIDVLAHMNDVTPFEWIEGGRRIKCFRR